MSKKKKIAVMQDKTVNNSKDSQIAPQYVFDEYVDLFSFNPVVVNRNKVLDIGREFIQWAVKNENALKSSTFFRERGIGTDTVKLWREKYPDFNRSYKEGVGAIGDRREIYGLKKEFDSGIVSYTMAHYDQEWKDLATWRAALKKESEGQQGNNITVVMEQYPGSKTLPEKTKQEDEL